MTKKRIVYRCAECGSESLKWQGRCPECGEWNSYREEKHTESASTFTVPSGGRPLLLSEVDMAEAPRFGSGSTELDRVLGSGVVPGSLVLLGGDPGIGKSTLLLQTAAKVASTGKKVLYATAEESSHQIKIRASRLGISTTDMLVMANNDIEEVERAAEELSPHFLVADSIQALYLPSLPGVPGTVSQVRQCTSLLMAMAKLKGIATFLVGHVTKEGSLAGPRVLEHMVDTVLYFEGDRYQSFRVLRATKNRFGSTNEIGVFEMKDVGLVDVDDPSRFFVEEHANPVSGSALVATVEGTRVIILEVQALVCPTVYPAPQRVCTGMERQRLALLLAVLERRAGVRTSSSDVFVNVVGGARLVEPASDLGIALAVASAVTDRPLPEGTACAGEIGLAGEIRRVTHIENRLKEAAKLGLSGFILSSRHKKVTPPQGLELVPVGSLFEALKRMGSREVR